MALEDLLRLLPKHERDRLQKASVSQRQLLSAYSEAHKEIVSDLEEYFQSSQLGIRPTLAQTFRAFHSARLIDLIENRVGGIDDAVGRVLRAASGGILDLVVAQVGRETRAIGVPPEFGTPDIGLIESRLEEAVNRIHSWNGQIAPQIVENLRRGLIQGEDYQQLFARIRPFMRQPDNRATPIARARMHMLANTRYSIVSAANAAREDAYKEVQRSADVQIRKMWWSSIESCCISCAKLHGQIVSTGDQFDWEPLGLITKPHLGQLYHPPLHPNCRCRIIPVTAEFLEVTDLDRVRRERSSRIQLLTERKAA